MKVLSEDLLSCILTTTERSRGSPSPVQTPHTEISEREERRRYQQRGRHSGSLTWRRTPWLQVPQTLNASVSHCQPLGLRPIYHHKALRHPILPGRN